MNVNNAHVIRSLYRLDQGVENWTYAIKRFLMLIDLLFDFPLLRQFLLEATPLRKWSNLMIP